MSGRRAKEQRKKQEQYVQGKDILTGVDDWRLTTRETYLGNPNVKAAYVKKELTVEQGIELYRCANSVEYFTENYVKIINIDDGIVPFKPYDYQRELLNNFQDCRFNIALQCRQSGKSTTAAAYMLWFALFHRAKSVAILANKESLAIDILDRINLMYCGLPFFMQQGATALNKKSISFENSSTIIAAATGSTAIRGKAIALLFLDEFAFVENDIEFWSSVYPTISSGKESRVIVTSTPKGARGKFYQLYQESIEGLNDFRSIDVKWDRVPGRDEAWKEQTIKALGSESQFKQEYENSFIGSAGGLIAMKKYELLQFKTPIEEIDDSMQIYEHPKENHNYVGTVDCAGGLGQDSSVITMFDVTSIPYKIVAKYKNNMISPLVFPYTIQSVCTQYNEAYVLVEQNTEYGGQVSYILYYDIEYENVIMTSPSNKDSGVRVGGGGSKQIPAIKMTKAVKGVGCSNLKTIIENDRLILNDLDTISDLGTFVENGTGSYAADSGCHDDTCMTCVSFAWLIKQNWFVDMYENNVVEDLTKDNEYMGGAIPFGVIHNAVQEMRSSEIIEEITSLYGNNSSFGDINRG